MRTKDSNSDAPNVGDMVAAACEMGSAIASDPAVANELAARHLERVLVRGSNARLAAALAVLALQFTPEVPRADRAHRAVRSPDRGRHQRGADRMKMTHAA